jgi:RND family efflux transporter MFP subunit
LSAAESRLAELEAGTRKEQIQLAVARVAQWQATVERLQVELTDSKLVAPFSGTVARRDADEGVVLPAGASVLRLVEPASEAWIGLPPDFTAALGERTHHRVSVAGNDYVATVRDILPEVDLETRTQTVVLSVQPERPEQSLPLPGQMARLTLPSPVSASGFWVPTTALSRGGKGLWALHVVVSDPPVVERRDVEVLRVDSDRVLVRGVIQSGESFVTTGLHRLTSGQRVKIENNSVENDVYSESASKFE